MHGLRTLILDVASLDQAKAFYSKALGKVPYFDEPFYVGFDIDGYELGLRPRDGQSEANAGHATTYLAADDVDAELARWVSLGATVKEPAEDVGEGIRVASITDPFGNVVGLIRNLHFAPKLVFAEASDFSPRAIVHEATFAAPASVIWPLWTTSEGFTKWLVDRAKIELRPGGAYELYFLNEAPVGTQGSETCRVLSFIPERMVSFTWNAPPHLANTRTKHTWVVVELLEESGSTRVRITHTGWPMSGFASEAQWEETFVYFDRAWQGLLGALQVFVQTGKKAD